LMLSTGMFGIGCPSSPGSHDKALVHPWRGTGGISGPIRDDYSVKGSVFCTLQMAINLTIYTTIRLFVLRVSTFSRDDVCRVWTYIVIPVISNLVHFLPYCLYLCMCPCVNFGGPPRISSSNNFCLCECHQDREASLPVQKPSSDHGREKKLKKLKKKRNLDWSRSAELSTKHPRNYLPS